MNEASPHSTGRLNLPEDLLARTDPCGRKRVQAKSCSESTTEAVEPCLLEFLYASHCSASELLVRITMGGV